MKLLAMIFGGGDEDRGVHNPVDPRLADAETYIESQWTSGLTRHYNAEAVVGLVERVRLRHGWPARPHSSYFPSDE